MGIPINCCCCCFSWFTIRFNEFKRNKLHVSSAMIVKQKKCLDTVVGLELLV